MMTININIIYIYIYTHTHTFIFIYSHTYTLYTNPTIVGNDIMDGNVAVVDDEESVYTVQLFLKEKYRSFYYDSLPNEISSVQNVISEIFFSCNFPSFKCYCRLGKLCDEDKKKHSSRPTLSELLGLNEFFSLKVSVCQLKCMKKVSVLK